MPVVMPVQRGVGGGVSAKSAAAKATSTITTTVTPTSTVQTSNWKSSIVCCGSNAFGQIISDSMDLMFTSMKQVGFPGSFMSRKAGNFPQFDADAVEIKDIACGSNLSCAVISQLDSKDSQIHLWGTGLPNTKLQMNIPVTVPARWSIRQMSCGAAHVGFVTDNGAAFTWGSGENGMLGHGSKASVAGPKRIDSLSHLHVGQISCGATHTAVIACSTERVNYIRLPSTRPNPATEHYGSASIEAGIAGAGSVGGVGEEDDAEFVVPGELYTFGLGKAGQLGVESLPTTGGHAGCAYKPALVKALERECMSAVKVSCGFHHTLIIAVPAAAGVMRGYSSFVFSCGWGEHGRLGLGSEDKRTVPMLVSFPEQMHATMISAGEQHSMVAGKQGCYAWGSNSHGQLGLGGTAGAPFVLEPNKVPLPEGMMLKNIACGGRHSAAITHCGKLLTWGWGEEGQLGHGSENNSYLARPCRLSRIASVAGRPCKVSLGMSHTVLWVTNASHVPKLVEEEEEEDMEELPVPVVAAATPPKVPSPLPSPTPSPVPPVVEEKLPTPPATPVVVVSPRIKGSTFATEADFYDFQEALTVDLSPAVAPVASTNEQQEEEEEEEQQTSQPIVQGIKDLILQRTPREESPRVPTPPSAPIVLTMEEKSVNNTEEEEEEDLAVPDPVPPVVENLQVDVASAPVTAAPSTKERRPSLENKGFNVYYRDGLDLDNCMVANSAKRAEARKLKKEEKLKEEAVNSSKR